MPFRPVCAVLVKVWWCIYVIGSGNGQAPKRHQVPPNLKHVPVVSVPSTPLLNDDRSPVPTSSYEPLTRYVKLQVAHPPGMPGTFSPPRLQRKPLVSDPGMHHGTCVTHVSWCMSGSLTRGGGKNVPGIPDICAIHNFTYLARGPLRVEQLIGASLSLHYINRIWRLSFSRC